MGLLYGSSNISRQELALLDTPEASGKIHRPVPFADYIGMVTDSLVGQDMVIKEEEYQLTHSNNRFFGAMQIAPANADSFLPGLGSDLIIGLRGSHDRIVPRGICIGTRVFVCSNLMFEGDLGNLKTRQTLNVMDRLQPMIDSIMGEIGGVAERNITRIDRYKDHDLKTSQHGDAILVDLYRKNILNAQQFGVAANEWIEPTFGEHQNSGDWTMWQLFNSITQAFKPVGARTENAFNHDTMSRKSALLVNEFDNQTGLLISA